MVSWVADFLFLLCGFWVLLLLGFGSLIVSIIVSFIRYAVFGWLAPVCYHDSKPKAQWQL